MTDLSRLREPMDVIGADGVHPGGIDKVQDDRIKPAEAESGSPGDHSPGPAAGLVGDLEGDQRPDFTDAANAVLTEQGDGEMIAEPDIASATPDSGVVAAQLLAVRDRLKAEVWPTAIAAAQSGDHERLRDLVKLKVDIEAIDFALGHRPAGVTKGDQQ
ncbi:MULTISPECIES: DUF2171 domain-containing protein [unclassified Brevundimonas]|uniref:DUF2171 domain-containing protein n=1 Tax=unclassified Brevundimonas TaxID=2622653 RepID=UPI0025BAD9A7|nr:MULTISPECIES: DUF2171 domain-containing protein [unclassified Brevundimonas]